MDNRNRSEQDDRPSSANIFAKMMVNPVFMNSENSEVLSGTSSQQLNASASSITSPPFTSYLDSFNTDLDCDAEPDADRVEVVNLSSTEPAAIPFTGYIGQKRSIGPGSISIEPPEDMPNRKMFTPAKRGRGRKSNIDMSESVVAVDGTRLPGQMAKLRQMFPKINKLVIDRSHTSTLFDFDKTVELLNEKQRKMDEERARIKIVPNPKTDKKELNKQPRGEQLMNVVPQGRNIHPYYRRLLTINGELVTAPPKIPIGEDDRIIRDFMESRCKSYVSNEVTGTLLDEGNVTTRVYSQSMELPSDYLANNAPETPSLSVDLNATNQQLNESNEQIEEVDVNDIEDSNGANNAIDANAGGNRFFRTKRLCETELKKREYVSRELHQGWLGSRVANAVAMGQGDGSPMITSVTSYAGVSTPKYRGRARGGRISSASGRGRGKKRKAADSDTDDDEAPQAKTDAILTMNVNREDRASILSYFNGAPVEELAQIPGCSVKRAELIVQLRPFSNCNDLVSRLDSTKTLSSSLVQGCKEILYMRSMVVRLMTKCERISQKMSQKVSGLLNTVELIETDDPEAIRTQPLLLNPRLQLKPYQLVGLNWLRLLHSEQLNGILADDMGLGKTIQAISFLAFMMEIGQRGPHLIIVPSSTLDNWQRELAHWCPELKVLVYYGTLEERKAVRVKIYEGAEADFNILLTTYSVGTNSIEDRAMMKRINFYYGIFDEAHMLKNMTSQRYKNLMNFKVERRLLLTGTPLQNNLIELISLLTFVMPEIFAKSADLLKKMFQNYAKANKELGGDDKRTKTDYELARVTQAKSLLQPFCLRRLKSNVLDQLPPKSDEIVLPVMPTSQRSVYWEVVENIRNRLTSTNGESNGNESGKVNSALAINYIMQLRKGANHPLLLRRNYTDEMLRQMSKDLLADPDHKNANPEFIYEDMEVLNDFELHRTCLAYSHVLEKYCLPKEAICTSAKMAYLDTILPKMLKAGDRILIFSQFVIMLNILEEFLQLRSYTYFRLDGSTPVVERQQMIDDYNKDKSVFIFLLSTRAGGLGINLTGANVVILHDIDFNPYNDRQAEDRCHRIGQEKAVRVIRLVTEGTVEEGMLRIASDKLKLEEGVTGTVRRSNTSHQRHVKKSENTDAQDNESDVDTKANIEIDEEEDDDDETEPAAVPINDSLNKTLKTLKGQLIAPIDDISSSEACGMDETLVQNVLSQALTLDETTQKTKIL